MPKPFLLVELYVDGPHRFRHATVLSEHETAAEAFAELARLTERLQRFGIAPDDFQWVVVDAKRRPVRGH
jgi:hypothetical protein